MLSYTVHLCKKERNIIVGQRDIRLLGGIFICCPFILYIPHTFNFIALVWMTFNWWQDFLDAPTRRNEKIHYILVLSQSSKIRMKDDHRCYWKGV